MPELQSKSLKPLLILAFITLTGALLRFYNYSTLSLFNDELSALTRVSYKTFDELILKGVMSDVHPAGIPVFLYMLINLFGNSEAVVRLPFVLAGIFSIPVIYFVGKKWFNDTTGLLAAAALAVLEYPVYFSQLARPYSIGMFMSLLFVYFMTLLVQTTEKKQPIRHYVGFILTGAACMYIHYFSFLFAAIAGFSGLIFIKKENLVKYVLCGAAMILLASPHYFIYKYQLSVGGVGGPGGWLGPPNENALRNFINYIFNDSWWVYLSFTGIAVTSFIIYRKTVELRYFHILCVVFFITPFLIAYFYSIYVNPVFQYSAMIFSFPFLLLLLFSFLPANLDFRKLIVLVFLVLSVGGFSTVIEKQFYTTEHFAVFKELAQKTIEINNKYGDINIINTINIYDSSYINYYFKKFNRPVKMAQYRCSGDTAYAELIDLVSNSNTPYFLHAWSNIYEPPETEDIIMKAYPYRILYDPHFNSALSLYAKRESDTSVAQDVVFTAVHDFETNKWPNDSLYQSSVHFRSGRHSSNLSDKEYGNTFTSNLKDMGYKNGYLLSISFWIYSPEIFSQAKIVATIQDKPGTALFWDSREFDLFHTAPSSWEHVFFTCTPTGDLNDFSVLKIFPWNINKKRIWIDDLEIRIKKPLVTNSTK